MFANGIRRFFKLETASGILLMGATILAMIFANSGLSGLYERLLGVSAEIRIGGFELSKPLLLWINDGLMAVFFLLVGLEVKREILEGQLSSVSRIVLPGVAAVGGMIVPALIYAWFNWGDQGAMDGWAIPTATDIAFALGVLALVGKGLPPGLKLFLLTVAIFDDIGAIVIIAIFYSGDLSVLSLVLAGVALAGLWGLNRAGVQAIGAYLVLGTVLWVLVLKSGVHATLAGVCLAFAIPLRTGGGRPESTARQLEHQLHPWVAFGILPLFAFANGGVSLDTVGIRDLLEPIPLGVAAGLFVGKQVGVLGFAWLAIRLGVASLPEKVSWRQLHGVALLCGVGFTMSLFIGSLAFEHGGADYIALDRLGILVGSALSGLAGYAVLRATRDRASSKGVRPKPASRLNPVSR